MLDPFVPRFIRASLPWLGCGVVTGGGWRCGRLSAPELLDLLDQLREAAIA